MYSIIPYKIYIYMAKIKLKEEHKTVVPLHY